MVQIRELLKIVIPKIVDEWESVAYCMKYTIKEVRSFRNDFINTTGRCVRLFEHWLTADDGPKPKTYLTLLKHIKKIDTLAAVSVAIEEELIEGM